MASSDVMAFSPSPFKQFQGNNMSSSPLLPSPSEIFKMKHPTLKSGIRATSIPFGLSSSLSTATLLKTSTIDDLPGVETSRPRKSAEANSKAPPVSKVTKTRAKKAAPPSLNNREGKVTKVCRKPVIKDVLEGNKPPRRRTKKTASEYFESELVKVAARKSPRFKKFKNLEDEPGKEKPAQKSRAKKIDADIQTKLPKAQVTKSSVPSRLTKSIDKSLPASPNPYEDLIDTGLVKAVRRTDGWSPPKHSSKSHNTSTDEFISDSRNHSLNANASSSNGFNSLLGNFGFTSNEHGAAERKASDGEVTRKRKLIELVRTNSNTAVIEPISLKTKAPKKKAKTITEQATSAYAEEKIKDSIAPLLEYFPYRTSERSASDTLKLPAKSRPRGSAIETNKSKRRPLRAPILLPPEAAIEQVHKQDFVFGTSSQLAREDSPSYLRDLHDAMHASNEMSDDPFDDPFVDIADELSTIPPASKYKRSNKKTLWSEGARNTTKPLLQVEVVDMIYTPATTKTEALWNTHAPTADSPTVWHDVDEDVALLNKVLVDANTTSRPGQVESAIRELLSSSPNIPSPKEKYPKVVKKAEPRGTPPLSQPAKDPTLLREPSMPDFGAYTTFQLEKQIAKYHFKPIKSRDAMVSLLQKCWEDQHRPALANLQPNVKPSSPSKAGKQDPVSSQAAPSTPKKRGRPKKDTSTTVVSPAQAKLKAKIRRSEKNDAMGLVDSDVPLSKARTPKKSPKGTKSQEIEEISDSDTHITPSPPRRRPSQIRSPLHALELSTSTSTKGPALSSASSQESLFKHITKAVKATPMTKDPSKPSWQEKILLYDPIIIEDLTLWLNTGALENVGWDGECIPKEVKKWCEGKSICCLWRENLRGGARSRY